MLDIPLKVKVNRNTFMRKSSLKRIVSHFTVCVCVGWDCKYLSWVYGEDRKICHEDH